MGYPKQTVNRVIKTVLGYDFNPWCLASTKTIKKFIFENKDVIDNIIEIKTVVKNENRSFGRRIKSAEKLRRVYNSMIRDGAPFDLRDLKVRGDDIIKDNPHINLENLDELLDKMLLKTAINPRLNSKQSLLAMARKMINSKRDYYLEDVKNLDY